MKPGETVYQTAKGKAVFAWQTDNGENMYRIDFSNGSYLHTNSMEIVKTELKADLIQLELFKPSND